jgi:hypothetical protein
MIFIQLKIYRKSSQSFVKQAAAKQELSLKSLLFLALAQSLSVSPKQERMLLHYPVLMAELALPEFTL